MERIAAGGYLQVSSPFSGNLKKVVPGKEKGSSFMDIFSDCLDIGGSRKCMAGNQAEKPRHHGTLFRQQNSAAAKEYGGVKERKLSGKAEQKVWEKDTETARESEDKSAAELMAAALQDILALLDRFLDGQDLSGEMISRENGESVAAINEELGEVQLAEDLRLFIREKLAELEGLTDNPETKELRAETENLLSKLRQISGETGDLFPEGRMEIEATGTDLSPGEVFAQLKAQCGELIDRLVKSQKSDTEDVSQVQGAPDAGVEAVIPEGDFGITEQSVSDETGKAAEIEGNPGKQGKINRKTEARKNDNSFKIQTASERTTDNLKTEDIVQMNYSVLREYKAETGQVSKPQVLFAGLREPIQQPVTDQVMTRIKIMAGEGKQEMEMELKPESLGKLTLKIIHEKGEILAKITAENERVRQILESNLQMLKDSLEENGFSVQSLTVSVGNGKKEQPGEGRFESERANSRIKVAEQKIRTFEEVEAPYTLSSLNYLYSDSQIDLTA